MRRVWSRKELFHCRSPSASPGRVANVAGSNSKVPVSLRARSPLYAMYQSYPVRWMYFDLREGPRKQLGSPSPLHWDT